MKHTHRGRVLTVVSRSEKAVRRSSELLPALPPLNSSVVVPSTIVALASGQSLEKENEKLRARLTEAEQSIANYRTLLNPTRGGVLKSNASSQTSFQPGSLVSQQSFGSSDDPEKKAEKLEKINAQLLRKIEELNRTAEESITTIEKLSTENRMLIEQIEKNAEHSSQSNEQAASLDASCGLRAGVRAAAAALGGDIGSMREDLSALRMVAEESFSEFSSAFDVIKAALDKIPSKLRPPSPPRLDCATSPVRAPAASAATSPVLWPRAQADVEDPQPMQRTNPECLPAFSFESPAQEITDDIIEVESTEKCVEDSPPVVPEPSPQQPTQGLVSKVKKFVEDLSKAHRLEINAVKHTAHCKDLTRLAAQRELALERDRTHAELKHAREVEDMLTFSLNAIERIVNETQPNVVLKLSENRAKKRKQLQNSLISRSRELDQRSTEIGAMNSAHLQTFQSKAQSNQKMRENETASILKLLSEELESLDATCLEVCADANSAAAAVHTANNS